jgi:hypothetical protein
LVPHQILPEHLIGAYVASEGAAAKLTELGFSLPVTVEPDLFFL